jgi:hypothetical protein
MNKNRDPRLQILYELFTRALYRLVLNKTRLMASSRSAVNSELQERQYSMSIQEVSAEQLAQLFHHYQQALASDFGCRSEQADQSWKDVPQRERNRMTAAARLALLELDSVDGEREDSKRYFAKRARLNGVARL